LKRVRISAALWASAEAGASAIKAARVNEERIARIEVSFPSVVAPRSTGKAAGL
jgi:hypothetical protein